MTSAAMLVAESAEIGQAKMEDEILQAAGEPKWAEGLDDVSLGLST